jgi:adenylylsulfate kinase-like enzyme
VNVPRAEGVLLTGAYGAGKSSVGAEIAYLLERRGVPYALLDLDYLSWAGTGTEDRAAEFALMLQNLTAVAANYRRAGSGSSCSPTLCTARARYSVCRTRWDCRCGWRA